MSADVSIYALCEPDSGEVRYIGQTGDTLSARLYNHITFARHARAQRPINKWLRALVAQGEQPVITLLDTAPNRQAALAQERAQISAHMARGCTLLNVLMTKPARVSVARTRARSVRHPDAMTWQALVRLPDDAGVAVGALAKRLGVERAVAARIVIMQWFEAQERAGGASQDNGDAAPARTTGTRRQPGQRGRGAAGLRAPVLSSTRLRSADAAGPLYRNRSTPVGSRPHCLKKEGTGATRRCGGRLCRRRRTALPDRLQQLLARPPALHTVDKSALERGVIQPPQRHIQAIHPARRRLRAVLL